MLVVIVTDNGFAAEAIRRSFTHASGLRVAGYVDGRRPCAAAVEASKPDVVLVDEMTRPAWAVERVRELRGVLPRTKIIVLMSRPGAEWLSDAVRAGATAAIAKTVQPTTLALLVRDIWLGNIHHAFDPPAAAAVGSSRHVSLTARELQILELVAEGASNGRIARQLWVTEQTVKFHLSNVYRKLGVSNRTEASRYAHLEDLVRTDRPALVDVDRAA